MSNTSKGKGIKGSKYWMQEIVNTPLQGKLNDAIGGDLTWLSPLKVQYLEYQMNSPYICNIIGISQKQKKDIFSFWPSRQPQWDGIALSQDKKTVYLVEAKAHLSELNSSITKRSKGGALIEKSMEEVLQKYYPKGNLHLWKKGCYQLGNRLTFMNKLNEAFSGTDLQFKLVLLNLVNDRTYKPTLQRDWEEHYKEVFKAMIGQENPPNNVIVINFEV